MVRRYYATARRVGLPPDMADDFSQEYWIKYGHLPLDLKHCYNAARTYRKDFFRSDKRRRKREEICSVSELVEELPEHFDLSLLTELERDIIITLLDGEPIERVVRAWQTSVNEILKIVHKLRSKS